ncbi:putative uncharacterized protein DDB_G0286901 [Chironomus tepperi]|uniref:putative uncharacterized protein DDB_G0286901 n=1 Tax=Chironomus tepperi TaxID=113505 RepID=UPI00391FA504
MELLIVLGLCFGAYELLGVFQGCFHYNEHPLPYQSQAHNINSLNNNGNNDTKDNENDNDNEQSGSEKEDDNRIDTIESRPKIRSSNDDEDENLDNTKSGPCSCYSTVTEDDFDDDTRVILRNSLNRKLKRQQILRKPINKYSLSTSLMSLSRDDSTFLFNYLDDNSNNKFQKFKSDIEISETSFNDNYNEKSYNDNRINRNCREHFDVSSSDLVETTTDNNEDINCNTSVNLDTNKKKIFFISAAS